MERGRTERPRRPDGWLPTLTGQCLHSGLLRSSRLQAHPVGRATQRVRDECEKARKCCAHMGGLYPAVPAPQRHLLWPLQT